MRVPLLLACVLFGQPLFGQEEEVGKPYWVSTPPGATASLKAATAAIAGRDWNRAARSLQTVFDRYPAAFAKSGRTGSYVGARHRAVQLLATAPQALREEYERLYATTARESFATALAGDDRAALLDVVRRFEPTPGGFQAIIALTDRALLRGRPAEARLLLTRLRALHPTRLAEAGIKRRIAVAAARDHTEGGPKLSAGERAAGALDLPRLNAGAWPMLGGGPTRYRPVDPPDLSKLPPLQYDPIDVQIQQRAYDRPPRPSSNFGWGPRGDRGRQRVNWERRWATYNPVHPVVARGRLVFHDGRRLFTYNLFRGELAWQFPERDDIGRTGRTNLSSVFTPVVADGTVYAALEVDVPFRPQNLQGIPITYYVPQRRLVAVDLETGEERWRHDDAWFDAHPESEPLRRLSMTGPPVVRGDTIYLGACYSEGTFHNFVVAVDRHSGEMIYRTRISNGQQELNLFGRQLQECMPTPMTEVDGVLYYGTNLGVFTAVDALLGTPLWASSYPILRVPSTYFWFEAPRRWSWIDNNAPLVAGDTIVVAPADGTHVLGLDRRSGRIRWRTLARLQHAGRALSLRALHGTDGKRAFFSGPEGVTALWLADDAAAGATAGKVAWEAPFFDDTRGAGRGFVTPKELWVPSLNAVYRFELATGRALGLYERQDEADAAADDEGFSHLVWADGVLVTAGRDFVSARFDPATVVARAKAAIRAQPDAVGPLLGAADVYLAIGAVEPAIEQFRRAKAAAATSGAAAAERRAAQGLHRALLQRARASLADGEERAAGEFETAFRAAPDDRARLRARRRLHAWLGEGDGLAGDATHEWRLRNLRALDKEHGDAVLDDASGRVVRTWALREIATLHINAGEHKRALAVLQRLLELDATGEDGRHAYRAVRSLLERHGRTLYAPYEKRAQQLFDDALRTGDLEALERGLRIYANAEAAVDVTLELARRRLAADNPADAGRVLQEFLVEHGNSTRAPEARALLFRSLHERGSTGPAYGVLLRLKTRYADARIPRSDGAVVTARDFADAWLEKEPYRALARSVRRRDLAPRMKPLFVRTFGDGAFLDVPVLLGQRPEKLPEVVILRAGARAHVLDAESGRDVYSLEFGAWEPQGPIVFAGDRLHAVTDRRLYVFDAMTGRLKHRRPVPQRGYAMRLLEHRGQLFLVFRVRRAVWLAALQPSNGEVLWSRQLDGVSNTGGAQRTHIVARGDRLFVFTSDPVGITVIDPTSGAVENRTPLAGPRSAAILSVEPVFLPGGRVLVGLSTPRQRGFEYLHTYSVMLVDPGSPPDGAILWKHGSPADGADRNLLHMNVAGDYVACLDETRSAAVLDLRTGDVVKAPTQLPMTDRSGEVPFLDSVQPHHDSLLLVLTRSVSDTPARLSAYELPDLRRKYSLKLTDDPPAEVARLIDAQGALGVSIAPRRGRPSKPRVHIYDPLTGKLLDEIRPDVRAVGWINARVQNGILLLTTNTNTVYAYGPR